MENYDIIITKKNIKNLILKIKKDGSIHLSVPKQTPKEYIDNFIESKKEWIEKHLEKVKNKKKPFENETYEVGAKIFYLGEAYNLKFFQNSKEFIIIENDIIKIYTPKPFSKLNIENIIYKWYRKNALKTFKIILDNYSTMIFEKYESFRIRKMILKWGLCRFSTREITLNIELIRFPIEAIKYVILHELCHLKYPHHKKEFWDFLEMYMPDWKKNSDLLK